MIEMKAELYNQSWLKKAQSEATQDSWAFDVIADVNGSGGEYLAILRESFLSHPFPSKGKKEHVKNALESLANYAHLGAVNELCWYRLMFDLSLSPEALPEGSSKTPDFKGTSTSGTEFFCEVTTLNVSSKEAACIAAGNGAPLNQNAEISRIIRKSTDEKVEQLRFGQAEQKGIIFVVFDYSTFSGLGTQRPLTLADALLKTSAGLQAMQPHLSAIIYVERYVKEGRCHIRMSQSAVCHNPSADFPMPIDLFGCFKQYHLDSYGVVDPNIVDMVVL
ncbi:MAG: hypothetical protein ACE5GF_05755 [Thermodesulfobacteriota bacterium]